MPSGSARRRRNGPTSCASGSSGSMQSSRSSRARRRSAPPRRSPQQGDARAGARHAGRSARRDRRGLVVVLDRPQERRQSAGPTRPGAGESEGSRRLGRPRPFPRAHDRRRALRARDAVRRQRNHGALQPSLPPLSPLVDRRRNPVVGLHVRVGLQGCDHALRLSARVSRHLLAHHLRRAGSDLLRRPAEAERSEGRRADRCDRGACGPVSSAGSDE